MTIKLLNSNIKNMDFCNCAIDLSLQSTHDRFHHGAILVKGHEIVGRGYNNNSYHAEVNAILQCAQRVL